MGNLAFVTIRLSPLSDCRDSGAGCGRSIGLNSGIWARWDLSCPPFCRLDMAYEDKRITRMSAFFPPKRIHLVFALFFTFLVFTASSIVHADEQELSVSSVDELVAATQMDSERLVIRLSEGTYKLTKPLRLKSGTRLLGNSIDDTVITHSDRWRASAKSLPDPETRLDGMDTESYLIRLNDRAENIEIANVSLRGPHVHGAVFGMRPTQLHVHHVKIQDFMWSGLRTLGMSDSKVMDCEFVDAGGRWKRGGEPGEKGGISGGAMFLTWVKDCEIAHNRIRRTTSAKTRAHYGIKGRQGRRCRIHHNSIETNFSIEFPFEGDQDMEIDHNVLRGAVSIPKHAGGKVPQSGVTFHIHHNYLTTSYAIEFVRNGVEVDHNLFDFDVQQDGGNLISGFGKAGAQGPAKFHNNLVSNPGRGVIWINEPYEEFEIRNNHIITRTTATPRTEGLFALRSANQFSKLSIHNNIVRCIGQPRPLLRNESMYEANVADNLLVNVSDSHRFDTSHSQTAGLESPLRFACGVHGEFQIDQWIGKKSTGE